MNSVHPQPVTERWRAFFLPSRTTMTLILLLAIFVFLIGYLTLPHEHKDDDQ
jgi:hypothetical protein